MADTGENVDYHNYDDRTTNAKSQYVEKVLLTPHLCRILREMDINNFIVYAPYEYEVHNSNYVIAVPETHFKAVWDALYRHFKKVQFKISE